MGNYSDGVVRDITSGSAGTTYTTQSGSNLVVTVTSDGMLTAVSNGLDVIIVDNGLQSASVPVQVQISGAPSCAYAIAPTNQVFSWMGGSNTVVVTATTGCVWTAFSGDSWITITSGNIYSNNGVVTYTVATNYSNVPLIGRMTIAGQLLIVNQSQQPFTYTTNSDDTITITGYTGTNGVVAIPSTIEGLPVTGIGANAFQSNTNLTSITIPVSVTSIGSAAFQGCPSLTGIYFQGNAPSGGSDVTVFSGDNNATVYYLPGATGFGTTFGGVPTAPWTGQPPVIVNVTANPTQGGTVTGAGTYNIGSNVTVCASANASCYSFVNWTDQNSNVVSTSACYAFTATTNATLAANFTPIAAQYTCTYTTNNAAITITGYTGCGGALCIPSTINGLPVTSIGTDAFWGDYGLTSVTIPASVTNIGYAAFGACFSLTAITVDPNNPAYSSVAGVLFDKGQTTLIQCPGGEAGAYTIPSSVTSIGDSAFAYCTSLTSVTIPYSVTSIGVAPFWGCTSLSAIMVDPNNPAYSSVAGVLFDKSQTTLIQYPGGLAGSYTIPASVTNIGYGAFDGCTSLTSVTIPYSVTSIWDYAFSGCTSLTSVYFTGNAPSADSTVFSGDNNATVYYLPGATGFGTTFGEVPTAPWTGQPLVIVNVTVNPTQGGTVSGAGTYNIGSNVTVCASANASCYSFVNWTDQNSNVVSTSACYTFTATTTATLAANFTPVAAQYTCTYTTNNAAITITGYTGCGGALSIPSTIEGLPVTSIGENAFWSDSGLTSVTIPASVTSVGDSAFAYCTGLTSVTIPNSVTSIGDGVFYSCGSLTSVTIGTNVTSIGYVAFGGCGSLTSVTIPSSVTSIGEEAFWDCSSLTSVTIPNSVTSIGDWAFSGCTGLTSVTIPYSVTSIGVAPFLGCTSLSAIMVDPNNPAYSSVAGVLFDKSQTTLIQYPGGLAGSYTIPASVTNIGYGAFDGCTSLTSVTIPYSVTSIGDDAFYNCTGLNSVDFMGNAPSLGDSTVFSGDNNATVYYLPGAAGFGTTFGGVPTALWTGQSLVIVNVTANPTQGGTVSGAGTYNIGSNVTVCASANASCYSFVDWTDQNSNVVSTSACYAFTATTNATLAANFTPVAAQYTCTYTTNNAAITITGYTGCGGALSIPSTINGLPVTSIGTDAFWGDYGLTSVTIPASVTNIGDEAFEYCTSLTSVTIPNSVTSIGYAAFQGCSSLTNVTIPSSVTTIGAWAFAGCTGLTSVTIPYSVTSIGVAPFASCTSLSAIMVDPSNPAYSSVAGVLFDKGQTTLIQCPGGTTGAYTIPSSVTSIGYAAFGGCTGLTSVTIPNSVTSIWDYAFYNCTSLTSVTIPNSVTSIGYAAFQGCSSLTNVTIGNSVTYIEEYAFNGCTSLTSVTIPYSVTSIWGYAFYNCTSLTSVYFTGNAPSADSTVFSGDNNATVYYLPGAAGFGTTFGGVPTALWTGQSLVIVNVTANPTQGGTVSGAGTYNIGSNVTVCATANSCYSFVDWTVNGNAVSTLPCYSFAAVSTETLVANFALNVGPTSGSLTSLWSFTGGSDGANPQAGLVQGSDGNFYGTAQYGGTYGDGTVFQISPSGTYTTLYQFGGSPTDGQNPAAGLVQGSDGYFYGTTQYGGTNYDGTVFRVSPAGALTTLWQFCGNQDQFGNCLDGANPSAGLVQGSDGYFYGTTQYGGTNYDGTVFRISPAGALTTLWQFCGNQDQFGNCLDGANPSAGLVQGSDGYFYGTTQYGGTNYDGTVFRISPSGNLSNLWSFTGGSDGAYPYAPLVEGSDGNFYGTAQYGGTYYAGTVFQISPSGSLTNLWSFTGCVNGGYPQAGLVQGSDGNFYGTTSYSGSRNGTVFRISPSGSLTMLWSFTGGGDGANPYAPLVQGSDGNFYGTAQNGGTYYAGTVFRISCGLCAYDVTVTSAPAGGGSTSGAGIYSCGSNVTVCASANASCYSFVNWTDQNSNVVSTSACYAFTATTNATLAANFTPTAAQYTYTTNNAAITITGYTDCGGALSITNTINGLPVTGIGDYAFYASSGLTSVTIPTSVTSIGDWAFAGCTNLTSVTIPYGVTSIGVGPFASCTSLSAIMVDPNNSVYSSVAGVLFDKSQTTLIEYPAGIAGSYTIPAGVTSIGDDAFASCPSLTSVAIGNGVTSIGDWAFQNCSGLTSVYFQGNAPTVANDVTVFLGDTATVYYLPGTTGWGATFDGLPTALCSTITATPQSALEWYTLGYTNDAVYTVYPSGSAPIQVYCLMSVSGGGWTELTSAIASTALNTNTNSYREYLYVKNGTSLYYRTPESSLVWNWASGQDLDGTYYYSGSSGEQSFVITPSSEHQQYGVGGSSGGGATYKCLVYYTTYLDPSKAQVQLCQDLPGIFGAACQGPVTVYIRESSPTIVVQPTNQVTVVGASVQFSAIASGAAPLSYQWFFNQTNLLSGGTNATLSLNNIQTGNAGGYMLVASNTYGSVTSSVATLAVGALDTVGDGIPDAWRAQYFPNVDPTGMSTGSLSCATCDADGTGQNNLFKYLAGLNPTNSAAYLHIISIAITNTTDINVIYLGANGDSTWSPGIASRTNVLDYTTGDASGNYTNGGWQDTGQTNILSGGTGTGVVTNMVDAGGATNGPARYYRIEVIAP